MLTQREIVAAYFEVTMQRNSVRNSKPTVNLNRPLTVLSQSFGGPIVNEE